MRPMAGACAAVIALALGMGSAAAARAEDAAKPPVTPVGQGPSWSVEGTGSWHDVGRPYFGTLESRDDWGEGFSRVRLNEGRADGLWVSVGVVGMGTAGTDYFGAHEIVDGRLDQLEVGASNLGGTGVNLALGRQDLVMGDGFLIGDGYYDHRAALWNIPLNFYDGVRADWKNALVHALAFGVNLSPSFGADGVTPRGGIYGGELGLTLADGGELSVAYLQQSDSHATDFNANCGSLRASFPAGVATLSGEGVVEGGTLHGRSLQGKGAHVKLVVPVKHRWSPVVTGEYFYFSGGGSNPLEDDGYYPWQFRWNDWSQYFVGDLLSSTVGTATDMRIVRAQVSVAPREGTGVRLLAHRFDRALGTYLPGLRGARHAFAWEYDLVVDQALGEHWSAWVMGAYATPLEIARADFGDRSSTQLFASVSWKFGGPAGAAE